MNTSKTRQGGSVSVRGSPTFTNCLLRCARPGLSRMSKFGKAPKEMMEYLNWLHEIGQSMQGAEQVVKSPRPEVPVLQLRQHTAYYEPSPTQTTWRLSCGQQTACCNHNKSPAPPHFQAALWSTNRSWPSSHRLQQCFLHSSGKNYNTYSLLQLSGIGSGGVTRLSDIFRHLETRLSSFSATFKAVRRTWLSRLATSTTFTKLKCHLNLPQTFQQLPAPTAKEYILTIPETQTSTSQVIQPPVASKGQQQQTRVQPTFYIVIDDQQAGSSRPLTFTDADEASTIHQLPQLQAKKASLTFQDF